jgi:hypothetical protein
MLLQPSTDHVPSPTADAQAAQAARSLITSPARVMLVRQSCCPGYKLQREHRAQNLRKETKDTKEVSKRTDRVGFACQRDTQTRSAGRCVARERASSNSKTATFIDTLVIALCARVARCCASETYTKTPAKARGTCGTSVRRAPAQTRASAASARRSGSAQQAVHCGRGAAQRRCSCAEEKAHSRVRTAEAAALDQMRSGRCAVPPRLLGTTA